MIEGLGVVALAVALRKPLGRFVDWFMAERGTEEGKNGWV